LAREARISGSWRGVPPPLARRSPLPRWGPSAPGQRGRHPAPPADPRGRERPGNFRSGL